MNNNKVVYFPACINRIFGISDDYDEKIALSEKTTVLLKKAGYEIIYPKIQKTKLYRVLLYNILISKWSIYEITINNNFFSIHDNLNLMTKKKTIF